MTLEQHSNRLLAYPGYRITRFCLCQGIDGFNGRNESGCPEAVEKCLNKNITDWGKIKSEIKDTLSDFVWKRTQRRPMILPIIMEAEV